MSFEEQLEIRVTDAHEPTETMGGELAAGDPSPYRLGRDAKLRCDLVDRPQPGRRRNLWGESSSNDLFLGVWSPVGERLAILGKPLGIGGPCCKDLVHGVASHEADEGEKTRVRAVRHLLPS